MKIILQNFCVYAFSMCVVLLSYTEANAQVDSTAKFQENVNYYPMGDPEVWTVSFTPFLWLPSINGKVESDAFENQANYSAFDVLSNVKMAFMIQAEVSKGKFFITPSYLFTNLGSEQQSTTDFNGEPAVVAIPEMKMNIVELVVGMRFPISEKFIVDGYIGTRYDNFKISASFEGVLDTTNVETSINIWDPVFGFRVHYYPHPRIPIMLAADIGGLTEGLKLSWTSTLTAGYTISPTVDLLLGFSAYGIDYSTYSPLNNPISVDMTMVGLSLGAKILIPKRKRDTSLFKKVKKKKE